MSRSEPYMVHTFEPLTVNHCLGSGLRARFRGFNGEPDHLSPVAAMAVCRVKSDWYRDGMFVRNEAIERQLCGVITYKDGGFALCEETSNFVGYIQPGESEE